MKTIYKYELETSDEQEIEMPLFSEIICLQLQNDKSYIWVKIDTEFSVSIFTILIPPCESQ